MIRALDAAIVRAEKFLVANQAHDGFWRDYTLKPGQAEDWATACVGWALARPPMRERDALIKATRALHDAWRPGGWGYNRDTVCDADSTAWVTRFLAAMGDRLAWRADVALLAFVDADGHAHTFRPPEEAGSWGWAHADVTPVVGLALHSLAHRAAARIRSAVLSSQRADGAWPAFWWACDAYATAWSLEFLRVSGGIPEPVAARAAEWLDAPPLEEPTAIAASQRVLAACALGRGAAAAVEVLLDGQAADGGWLPSPVLLAPPKDGPTPDMERHSDDQRLLGTAMATLALKRLR